jgi:hypothetical protein
MVPRLRECHIIRDSWTKLNVSPAKIMQVTNNNILGSYKAGSHDYYVCTAKGCAYGDLQLHIQ